MQKIKQFSKSLFFFLLIPGVVYLFFGIINKNVMRAELYPHDSSSVFTVFQDN